MKGDRIRIVESERCGRCGAMMGQECRKRRLYGKRMPCLVRVVCRRCMAQRGECRCPVPVMRPGDLYCQDHPAVLPIDGYARRYALGRPGVYML